MAGRTRSARIEPLEALFCTITLLGLIILAYTVGRTSGVSVGRDEITAREHYEREKKIALSACTRSAGVVSVECATRAIEAAQEKSDTRQDLYAQQDAARWAYWAMLATWVTFAVTALGVWFVKRTLDATLTAVKDTSEATDAMREQNNLSRKSTRAWLDAVVDVKTFEVGGQHAHVYASIELRNIGSSPALIKNYNMRVTMFGDESLMELDRDDHNCGACVLPNNSQIFYVRRYIDKNQIISDNLYKETSAVTPAVDFEVLYDAGGVEGRTSLRGLILKRNGSDEPPSAAVFGLDTGTTVTNPVALKVKFVTT